MKNMMLRAKNWSNTAQWLCVLSLCVFVACKGPTNPPDTPTDPDNPHKTEAIAGNVARPTWTAPTDYDMSSSMTAVAKADLSYYYSAQLDTAKYQLSEDDILAAFAGSECVGVAEQKNGLFYMYITAPTSGAGEQSLTPIVFRYYSVTLKNIFVSEDHFMFTNDKVLGSVSKPYVPVLVVEK